MWVDVVMDLFTRVRCAMVPRRGRTRDPDARPRILVIDELVPDPLFGAGFPRAHEIVRTLVDSGHQVDLYPMTSTPAERARVTSLFDGAVRFHKGQGVRGLRRLLWRDGDAFDVLFVSRPTTMKKFMGIRWRPRDSSARPAVIYDAETVVVLREKIRRALYPPAMSDDAFERELSEELDAVRGADAVTTVGPADADLLRTRLGVPTFVVPHAETVRVGAPGFAERRDLLFVGPLVGDPSESPNVDSVRYFVTEVMPRLDLLIGSDHRLRIAGLVDSAEVRALESDRVVFEGVVEDLEPLYDSCRVFVAPTRFAAGIPLKVIGAMSEGVPSVVTRLLAVQLRADDSTMASADDADGFAQACARLYSDPAAWEVIRDGGLAYVDRFCSPAAFTESLADVLNQVSSR
ncbi:glycosyltransferase [Williamsia phyllosphaerae]|uniref:Uncharacterized protein n=1 Tax=Williamsia phyllosphaerae TaxID=885042 RepID=A0ABQ1UI92_9NOCA|nr:glycosyltransferase [Williamsia phyllosphaerae]GGF18717.1 hypothetical protein GCM10007298_13390 [Williamsia phyllosphaerae]